MKAGVVWHWGHSDASKGVNATDSIVPMTVVPHLKLNQNV